MKNKLSAKINAEPTMAEWITLVTDLQDPNKRKEKIKVYESRYLARNLTMNQGRLNLAMNTVMLLDNKGDFKSNQMEILIIGEILLKHTNPEYYLNQLKVDENLPINMQIAFETLIKKAELHINKSSPELNQFINNIFDYISYFFNYIKLRKDYLTAFYTSGAYLHSTSFLEDKTRPPKVIRAIVDILMSFNSIMAKLNISDELGIIPEQGKEISLWITVLLNNKRIKSKLSADDVALFEEMIVKAKEIRQNIILDKIAISENAQENNPAEKKSIKNKKKQKRKKDKKKLKKIIELNNRSQEESLTFEWFKIISELVSIRRFLNTIIFESSYPDYLNKIINKDFQTKVESYLVDEEKNHVGISKKIMVLGNIIQIAKNNTNFANQIDLVYMYKKLSDYFLDLSNQKEHNSQEKTRLQTFYFLENGKNYFNFLTLLIEHFLEMAQGKDPAVKKNSVEHLELLIKCYAFFLEYAYVLGEFDLVTQFKNVFKNLFVGISKVITTKNFKQSVLQADDVWKNIEKNSNLKLNSEVKKLNQFKEIYHKMQILESNDFKPMSPEDIDCAKKIIKIGSISDEQTIFNSLLLALPVLVTTELSGEEKNNLLIVMDCLDQIFKDKEKNEKQTYLTLQYLYCKFIIETLALNNFNVILKKQIDYYEKQKNIVLLQQQQLENELKNKENLVKIRKEQAEHQKKIKNEIKKQIKIEKNLAREDRKTQADELKREKRELEEQIKVAIEVGFNDASLPDMAQINSIYLSEKLNINPASSCDQNLSNLDASYVKNLNFFTLFNHFSIILATPQNWEVYNDLLLTGVLSNLGSQFDYDFLNFWKKQTFLQKFLQDKLEALFLSSAESKTNYVETLSLLLFPSVFKIGKSFKLGVAIDETINQLIKNYEKNQNDKETSFSLQNMVKFIKRELRSLYRAYSNFVSSNQRIDNVSSKDQPFVEITAIENNLSVLESHEKTVNELTLNTSFTENTEFIQNQNDAMQLELHHLNENKNNMYLGEVFTDKISVPECVYVFLQYIEANESQAHLIGGFVRDSLLDIESKKFININIITDISLPQLQSIVESVLATKLIAIPNKDNCQLYAINLIGATLEMRLEKKGYDLREIAKKIDFTLNAVAASKEGEIYFLSRESEDFYLTNNKFIHTVGSALNLFRCDRNGILRAIRFSVETRTPLSAEVKIAILLQISKLKEESFSSIKNNLIKMFGNGYALLNFNSLIENKCLPHFNRYLNDTFIADWNSQSQLRKFIELELIALDDVTIEHAADDIALMAISFILLPAVVAILTQALDVLAKVNLSEKANIHSEIIEIVVKQFIDDFYELNFKNQADRNEFKNALIEKLTHFHGKYIEFKIQSEQATSQIIKKMTVFANNKLKNILNIPIADTIQNFETADEKIDASAKSIQVNSDFDLLELGQVQTSLLGEFDGVKNNIECDNVMENINNEIKNESSDEEWSSIIESLETPESDMLPVIYPDDEKYETFLDKNVKWGDLECDFFPSDAANSLELNDASNYGISNNSEPDLIKNDKTQIIKSRPGLFLLENGFFSTIKSQTNFSAKSDIQAKKQSDFIEKILQLTPDSIISDQHQLYKELDVNFLCRNNNQLNKTITVSEYQQYFLRLIFEETRAGLAINYIKAIESNARLSSMKISKIAASRIKIATKYTLKGNLDLSQVNEFTNFLVLLIKSKKFKRQSWIGFGKARILNDWEKQLDVEIVGQPVEEEDDYFDVQVLDTISVNARLYHACERKFTLPFMSDLVNGKIAPLPLLNQKNNPHACLTKKIATEYGLNNTQSDALESILSLPTGVQVLQGPPGTGKTCTIAAITAALIAKGERVFICAPSNKAVQLIAKRLYESFRGKGIPIAYAGVENKLDPSLNPIFVVNWKKNIEVKIAKIIDFIESMRIDESQCDLFWNRGLPQFLNTQFNCVKQLFKEIVSSIQYSAPFLLRNKEFAEFSKFVNTNRSCFNWLPDKINDFLPDSNSRELSQFFEKIENNNKKITKPNILKMYEKRLELLIENAELIQDAIPLDIDMRIFNHAKIVISTLGVCGRPFFYAVKKFNTVIIDEASLATIPEIFLGLHILDDRQPKALFVGDINQLSPLVFSECAKKYHYDWSILEYLQVHFQPRIMLDTQYRMEADIREFTSQQFYQNKLKDGANIKNRVQPAFMQNAFIKGFKMVNIAKMQSLAERQGYYNEAEADAIYELLSYLDKNNLIDQKTTVGVITYYNGQVELLKTRLASFYKKMSLTVATVDSFQGEERDITLISAVHANSDKSTGFTKNDKRINVSITRAKYVSIILCNTDTFLDTDNTLSDLIYYAKEKEVFYEETDFIPINTKNELAYDGSFEIKNMPEENLGGSMSTNILDTSSVDDFPILESSNSGTKNEHQKLSIFSSSSSSSYSSMAKGEKSNPPTNQIMKPSF